MKTKILLLILFICFSNILNAQWEQTNGPYGGDIRCIALSGSNIYAGTAGGNGVYVSNDNGNHWNNISTGLPSTIDIHAIAVSGNNIFAGTYTNGGYGIYLSTNNGTNWTAVNNGLSTPYVKAIAISGTKIFAGTYNGVFLSNNNGSSWSSVSTGIPASTVIYSLAINGSDIYAGAAGKVYKSSNNGTSWTSVSTGITTSTAVNSITSDGTNIYAGTYGGIYISTNNGASWTAINTGLTNTSVHSISIIGTNIFAGTEGGVFLSTNNGGNWAAANNGMVSPFVYCSSVNGTNIFAGTTDGIFTSNNNGTNWVATGMPVTAVYALVIKDDTCIFAGTVNPTYGSAGAGIFLSTDTGKTWTAVNNGLLSYVVYSMAISGNNIFAGTDQGVFLSTNNGASWGSANNGNTSIYPITNIAISGNAIFTGTPSDGVVGSGGVFKSTDNGANWTAFGLNSNFTINSLVTKGNMLYAATTNGIWTSSIFGNSWSNLVFPATHISRLAVSGNNIFAAIESDGIYASINGSGFNKILTAINVSSISAKDSIVFVASNSGIQVSQDNGFTWKTVNEGFANHYASSFAISDIVYAGGLYGTSLKPKGVWTRQLNEMVCPKPIINPSGSTTFCQGNSITLSTSTGSNYIWSNTSTTQSITINQSGSYYVTVTDINGCSNTSDAITITVNPLPANAGTISGTATVCQGQNSVAYSVPTIANATSYIWSLPTGATGTSSTNSITINYGASAVSGNISVKGNNSCGDGSMSTRAITVNPLPANAGVISGTINVCLGENSVTYTVPTITNASSYIWSLPSGVSGSSSTNSITVNIGTSAVSGNITVKGHNTCGDGVNSTLSIIVNPVYAFTDNHSICNGDNYNWHGGNYTTANAYTAIYTSINGCDSIYTLNLTVNPVYGFAENHSICNGDTYNWHGTNYTTANTYTVNYTSINGCDSIYTLYLSVTVVDTSLTVSEPTITANAIGATYQWLDCNNAFANIIGETSQSYTASANGNFAVKVTQGLCSDTSACIQITTVGIKTMQTKGISVYPNPIVNELIIEISGNIEKTDFEILNSIGQVVFKGNISEKIIVQTNNFVPGIYLIKLENGNSFEFKKILKE